MRHDGNISNSWSLLTGVITRTCGVDVHSVSQVYTFPNFQNTYFAVGSGASIPISYTFTSTTSNSWNVAANWTLNVTPAPTTPNTVVPNAANVNVIIPNGKTVTLDIPNLTINSIALNGTLEGTNALNTRNLFVGFQGTLSLEGNITVAGNFEWTAGTIGKAAGSPYDVTVNGKAVINGTGYGNPIINRKLLLNGGGTSENANPSLSNNATIEIPVGQTLTYNGTGSFSVAVGAGNLFDVKGTFIKTGNNNLTLGVPFNNYGSVTVNSGQLILSGVGTSSGNFTVNTTEGINFITGCNHTFTGASINGTGSLLFEGGTATMSSNLILPLRMTSGTLQGTFNTIVTGNIELLGNAQFKPVGTVALTGNLILGATSPIFAPMGNTSVSGILTWSGGTIGSSTGAPFDVVIGGAATINTSAYGSTLANRRLVLSSGGTSETGRTTFFTAATLEIPLGQTFTYTATGAQNFTGAAGNLFDVKGIFVKKGISDFTIGTPISNTGAIEIEAGTLTVSSTYTGAGSLSTATGSILSITPTAGVNYTNATFVNNGTVSNNPLVFNGSAAQTLSGTGSIAKLSVDNLNNLAVTGIQSVTNTLTFTNGLIQLSTNDLTVGTTITGANTSRYIQTNGTGNLKRTVGTTLLLFPIGKSNYTPLSISQASGTEVYSARVRDGIDPNRPLFGTQFINKEWNISRPTSAIAATVKADWNVPTDGGAGFSLATAQMLHHNGTAWQTLPTVNRTTAAGSLTQSNITAFSPFAIGLPSTVLPLELLDFKAINNKSTIDLLWQTASEVNVSHFEIEQSTDGKTFSKIGKTKAKGGAADYQFTTTHPLSNRAYFRLKMVDFDEKFTYSKVVSLVFGKDLSVRAYPNPVRSELTIDAFSESKYLDIQVLDVLGRSMYQKRAQNTKGSKLLIVNTLDWNSGIYFLKVTDGKTVFQQKIIKE